MKKILLALTIGLAAMGCRDKDEYNPQLPPITQTGANTFGAVINGKVMVPRSSTSRNWSFLGSGHSCTYYGKGIYQDKYEVINASDCKETRRGRIYIYMENYNNNSTPIGTYAFEDSNGSYDDDIIKPKGIMMNCYLNNVRYLSIANTGSITITRNDDEVISGTFSCKLRNKDNPNDIIEIKDGRFDFNKATIYNTYFP